MADIIRRAMPPDFGKINMVWWPGLETSDLGIFLTLGGIIMALPVMTTKMPMSVAAEAPHLARREVDISSALFC